MIPLRFLGFMVKFNYMKEPTKRGIYIHPGRNPWPHEIHTARVLALAGHFVEFLPESHLKTADILLDGIEFEMKAPETDKTSSLEQSIRNALRQCPNIIIDACRMKMRDDRARAFLVKKCNEQKQIKKMLYITKKGEIIDIFGLI